MHRGATSNVQSRRVASHSAVELLVGVYMICVPLRSQIQCAACDSAPPARSRACTDDVFADSMTDCIVVAIGLQVHCNRLVSGVGAQPAVQLPARCIQEHVRPRLRPALCVRAAAPGLQVCGCDMLVQRRRVSRVPMESGAVRVHAVLSTTSIDRPQIIQGCVYISGVHFKIYSREGEGSPLCIKCCRHLIKLLYVHDQQPGVCPSPVVVAHAH